MQPRTIMTLAVSAGLTVATGVLAVGSNLLPSSASPRPSLPAAANVSTTDAPTTIVTQYQDVYDSSSSATNDDAQGNEVEAPESPEPTEPVVTTASSHEDEQSTESEHEDDSTESHSDLSTSSERND